MTVVQRELIRHHYVDGSADTQILDANCPHGESVCVLQSRVFGTAGQVVRYCAAGDARDWTATDDAGFLPTSLNQDTSEPCTAVGAFNDSLAVVFPEGAQLWDIALDPTENAIRQRLFGIGTTAPQSLSSFYRDLVFCSPFGVRSLSVQENVERVDENDVGVAIDTLVAEAFRLYGRNRVLGKWISQLGQYWLIFNTGPSSLVYAYTFSRSARLACWSVYEFPVFITGITTVSGKVYVRSQNDLYELDPGTFTDDGTPIEVDVQMAFQDAKLPGVEKMWYGADFVFQGTAQVSYLYDPANLSRETTPQTIAGDTRSGQLAPIEVTAAALAPRFQHTGNQAFSLDLATLYYHALSASV
jgi:hypothetical protein